MAETLTPSDLLALTPATLEDALTAFQDWMLDQGVLIVVTIVLALLARWALHRLIRRTVDTMSARATQRTVGRLVRLASRGWFHPPMGYANGRPDDPLIVRVTPG